MSQTLAPTDSSPPPDPTQDGAPPAATPATRDRSRGLYRAFWRWHFYASAIVVPVFAMLALTGLVMLFKWQLDPLQEPALRYDPPAHGAMVSLGQQEDAALARYPDAKVTAVQTASGDRSTFFTLDTAAGETLNVYVDPYSGRVLGARDPRSLVSNIATEIHGMIVFGPPSDTVLFTDPVTGEDFTVGSIGDRLIELATCWAIVMALTGYYLSWRGRRARLAAAAKKVRGAVLRRRHAVIGAWAGIGILLMVFTGLPWTGMWGSAVQKWATGSSFSLWGEDPGATSTLGKAVEAAGSDSVPAPWAEGAAPLPESGGHHHGTGTTGGTTTNAGIDVAVATAAADGVPAPYYVTYPDSPEGVYSVMSDMWHDRDSAAYADVTKERVVHVDQYTGAVAGRYSYDEYAPAAKVVTQGIAIHEGQRFGSVSLWMSAAFCVAILALCVTGPLMWWRRRRSGLSAPRGAMPIRATPWLLLGLVVLGVFLPLFGLTLVVVLLVDRLVVRRSRRLATALGSVPTIRSSMAGDPR